MGADLDDVRILQVAESIADEIWEQVETWNTFARETVGLQIVRSGDSIGANIAEAFGRYHYGEKLNHLYYARGSLFETKYWLNRSKKRNLISLERVEALAERLSHLAIQLNLFARSIKTQRQDNSSTTSKRKLRETRSSYIITSADIPLHDTLFSDDDLAQLRNVIS